SIDEIIYRLEECRINGIKEISIIHGYRHGNILKDYIRSEGFLIEMEKAGFTLEIRNSQNEGLTCFLIK
ncbi:MAG: Smr/MutS family protein, partial [Candidatus Lokiarchaeota archaeon]